MKSSDEKEIDELLQSFKGEEIRIPKDQLDERLAQKLSSMKRKRKQPIFKVAIVVGIIGLGSYMLVPEVQVFANQIVKSIFKDSGIQNAVDAGYPHVADVETNIGNYKMKLTNIFIDEQRLDFNIEVLGLPKEEQVSYSIHIDDHWTPEVGIGSSSFEAGQMTSIYVMGDGVKGLLKQEEIKIPLVLKRLGYSNYKKDGTNVIGEAEVVLKIPKELQLPAKNYSINKEVPIKEGTITISNLEVSPTVMTLTCSSQVKDRIITGLIGIKMIGSENKNYSDRTSITGHFDEQGGFSQYIIPSMYFDHNKEITFLAEGYSYQLKEPPFVEIGMKEPLPKIIKYVGNTFIITQVTYQNGKLGVTIKAEGDNKQIQGIYIYSRNNMSREMSSEIETRPEEGTHTEEDSKITTYTFIIEVPKQEVYKMGIDMVYEALEEISCKIPLTE